MRVKRGEMWAQNRGQVSLVSPRFHPLKVKREIAISIYIISPKISPIVITAACENPFANALDMIAKSPGPGVTASKNIAPIKAKEFNRVMNFPFLNKYIKIIYQLCLI